MDRRSQLIIFLLTLIIMTACTSVEPVEITRVVNQEVPVTVEVTRVVVEEVAQEVPVTVEVTRLVTAPPTPTVTSAPTATLPADPTEPATTTATLVSGATYTVRSGDTLALIAGRTGVPMADIQAANGLANPNEIYAGQMLIIPGWDGDENQVDVPPTATTAPPAAPTATPPASDPPPAVNLLPNPSFEGDWYFAGYNELQIPNGWQIYTDEGPNNLEPGSGGNFLRPEVRVISTADLPPEEHALFIFDGFKTVKAFKGGAPASFALFTDITLAPGTYRFQISYFADTVVAYENNEKIFATDPLAAESRIIFDNGGTGWQGNLSGQRHTRSYEFTLTAEQTVRLGAAFRNRYVMANNSWFIDDWSLYALN